MQTIMRPFTYVFNLIFNFLLNILGNFSMLDTGTEYVLAVVILTILVRLMVLPLSIKQIKSSRKMQEIQPELNKIKEKYKNDPQKLQQKTMQVYKDNDVSMMGGCLPLLIQMPIIMALYYVFWDLEAIKGVSFLWIHNLNGPDTTYILPILSALTTYLSSFLMTKSQPKQEGGMNMDTMNIVMSVMMGVFAINFPSLLVIYWIVGNIIMIVQNYFLYTIPARNKKIEFEKMEAEKSLNSKNSNNKANKKKIKNNN